MNETSLSPLFFAVQKSDLSTIKELLEEGCDVNTTNDFDETPLFLAETREVAELLVQHGADLEHKDQMGWTALENAAFEDNEELAEYYLQLGAKLYDQGTIPLREAVLHNSIGMAELLLKHGAAPNVKDDHDIPLLSYVTSPEMFDLLVRNGADPKVRDSLGATLLGLDPNIAVAARLLEAGVGIDDANDRQLTPLMGSAIAHNIELMQFLVEHGANLDARDEDGQSVLWYASKKEELSFLLEQGANPNAVDNQGRTLLMDCESELVDLLVEHGADLEARDTLGNTALMQFARPDKILALLRHGARADVRNNAGVPALMCCLANLIHQDVDEWNMQKILEALLETGVQPDITNASGQTLLMLLAEQRQTTLAGMLLDSGADPLLQDNNGESAFSMACKLQDKNMLKTMARSPSITEAVLDELAATGQFHNSTLKKLRKLVAGRS